MYIYFFLYKIVKTLTIVYTKETTGGRLLAGDSVTVTGVFGDSSSNTLTATTPTILSDSTNPSIYINYIYI